MHRYFLLILLLCNVVVASAENIGRKQVNKSSAVTIHYQGYSVSYNPDLLIPNWVSYELLADETDGPFTRKGKYFRQDSSTKVKQADNEDYKRSGWSRGHMAPAGDFKWNDEAMWETFYYTNCCPQDESLNSGLWNSLEMKVRGWAKKFGSIKVITGPIVGSNKNGTIGANRVVIPDAFFKALLVDDQAIAVVMLNNDSNDSIKNCLMTIDQLEEIIGMDIFSEVKDKIEKKIEATYSASFWGLK